MTKIELLLNSKQEVVGYEILGHTGYAQAGEDIVCSAISILAQTAILGLDNYLSKKPLVEIRDGYLKCVLPTDMSADEMEQAQIILTTMMLGLESTAKSYGEYMKINRRRCT